MFNETGSRVPNHSAEKRQNSFDLDKIKVPAQHYQKVRQLVKENEKAFAKHEYDLGEIPNVKVHIPTGSHPPIKQRMYPVPFKHREILKEKVDKMLDAKIIRRSHSAWASPCLLVDKKDANSKRLVIDYRSINKIIQSTSYPLPRIETILSLLNGSKLFTTLDLAQGYHQVALD